MSFEDERLRILQAVADGKLTPQQGQLEIAMMKVRSESTAPTAAPEPPRFDPNHGPQAAKPPLAPLLGLIAFPMVMMAGFFAFMMSFVFALPVYLAITLWNALLAPMGWPVLPFWPSLAASVFAFMVISLIGWGRRMRVAVNFGAPRG